MATWLVCRRNLSLPSNGWRVCKTGTGYKRILKYGRCKDEARLLSTNNLVNEWKDLSKGTLTVQRNTIYKAELFSMSLHVSCEFIGFVLVRGYIVEEMPSSMAGDDGRVQTLSSFHLIDGSSFVGERSVKLMKYASFLEGWSSSSSSLVFIAPSGA